MHHINRGQLKASSMPRLVKPLAAFALVALMALTCDGLYQCAHFSPAHLAQPNTGMARHQELPMVTARYNYAPTTPALRILESTVLSQIAQATEYQP